ncbi:MAG TPA: extracellular solute-binding protein [Microbacterium sp.]|nr:extracellular solute-binding protein [Microbacterium sp.]
MRFKKILSTAAIGAVSVGVLAGCSGGGGGADDENTLVLWSVTQETTQRAAMDAIIADFEEANPGTKIELEERSVDEMKTAMRQTAGTDAGPDIYRYWQGAGLGGELVAADVSLDLTEYYDEYGWEDRFTPTAMASITQYGGYHGVPFIQATEALYYNKTLFEEAGITDLPTTYDELVAAADKLVAAGITPIEFGGTVNWHVMRLLDSIIETKCGAETADALNTGDGDWSAEPCVTEAFTELKKWGDDYINEGFMGISNDDSSQLFFSGQAAMALEGTWLNSQVVDNGMDPAEVGIFPFPTGTGRLYGFGEGLYVSKSTDKADLAAKFLDFFTSDESQTGAQGAWSPISANKNVTPSDTDTLAHYWVDMLADSTGLYVNNDQNFSTATTGEYWRIQNLVLTGDLDPADAGAEFQKFRDANK